MPLKFAAEHAKSQEQPCPCKEAIPVSAGSTFRFSHNPSTEGNWITRGERQKLKRSRTCDAWGLSCYPTPAQAKAAYASLKARMGDAFVSKLGDHVAAVTTQVNDGLQTPANAAGHYNIHEDAEMNPSKWISRITTLWAI